MKNTYPLLLLRLSDSIPLVQCRTNAQALLMHLAMMIYFFKILVEMSQQNPRLCSSAMPRWSRPFLCVSRREISIDFFHCSLPSPPGLFWRIHQMDLTSYFIHFIIGTALSTYALNVAYRNMKFILKHKFVFKGDFLPNVEPLVLLVESPKNVRKR